MKIEPDLAVSYERPDDKTYVFKLREGVKFHNGQGLHGRGRQVHLRPHPRSRLQRASFGPSIRASRPSRSWIRCTIKFELKTTDAAFLNYLATNPDGAIVPKGVDNLSTQPVGTGPFIFESYQPNQQFTLTANPNYYEKGQPYLAKVVFKFYKDQATLSSALRSKAIDMTWLKDPKVAALMAKTSPDLVSAPGQTSRTFPVWLNMKAKPLNDVRVRRALSLATDRKACLDTVLGGSGKIGAMIPESQVGGYDGVGEMPYYKHDPAAAKKLLAEAGYPDGIDLGNYIIVAANPLDVACAQILQQQWQAAGITVKLDADGDCAAAQHVGDRDLADAVIRRAVLDAGCRCDLPVRQIGQQVRHRHGCRGPGTRQNDRRGASRCRSSRPRRQEPADPAIYR